MEKKSTELSIGFRVTPKAVHYSVISYDGTSYSIISVENLKAPKSFDEPNCLKHFRQLVFDLVNEHHATFGGIKLIEGNSQTKDNFRLNVEGVIQEAFASSSLTHYFFGTIPKLTGVFKFQDKKKVKMIIDGLEDLEQVDLKGFSKEQKEASLAALAAIIEHGH